MIDLLISKLKENKAIFAYEIYINEKDGRELFYVLNKLELNRALKTKNITCSIYVKENDNYKIEKIEILNN